MTSTLNYKNAIERQDTCRITGDKLTPLFSLGNFHISDFIPANETRGEEEKVPLELCMGGKGLVQLKHTTDFDRMYGRYWYYSGTNRSMRNQLKDIVASTGNLNKVKTDKIWLDIGCNDGTLLDEVFYYTKEKYTTVGIDPAENNCSRANTQFHTIINGYFSEDLFNEHFPGKQADVITSIAMFYDLEDPIEFCNQIRQVLADDGIWVIQVSYLPLMLDQLAFDNICHEHLEYYSIETLSFILDEAGFVIKDIQLNDTNGGSCRLYVQKQEARAESFGSAPYRDVANFRRDSIESFEQAYNLDDPATYTEFFNEIEELKYRTKGFIEGEVARGKRVWVYGASTKGNTLLQYFGLDNTLIEAASDAQENKHGLKTVGTNIPITSDEAMREAKPDYLLMLPWHFVDNFKQREATYLHGGGKFIVPCPHFEVIGA